MAQQAHFQQQVDGVDGELPHHPLVAYEVLLGARHDPGVAHLGNLRRALDDPMHLPAAHYAAEWQEVKLDADGNEEHNYFINHIALPQEALMASITFRLDSKIDHPSLKFYTGAVTALMNRADTIGWIPQFMRKAIGQVPLLTTICGYQVDIHPHFRVLIINDFLDNQLADLVQMHRDHVPGNMAMWEERRRRDMQQEDAFNRPDPNPDMFGEPFIVDNEPLRVFYYTTDRYEGDIRIIDSARVVTTLCLQELLFDYRCPVFDRRVKMVCWYFVNFLRSRYRRRQDCENMGMQELNSLANRMHLPSALLMKVCRPSVELAAYYVDYDNRVDPLGRLN